MTRDDAVVGEAAGLSMGLVMLGTRSPQAIEDMTNVSNIRKIYYSSIVLCYTCMFHSRLNFEEKGGGQRIHINFLFGIVLVCWNVWNPF